MKINRCVHCLFFSFLCTIPLLAENVELYVGESRTCDLPTSVRAKNPYDVQFVAVNPMYADISFQTDSSVTIVGKSVSSSHVVVRCDYKYWNAYGFSIHGEYDFNVLVKPLPEPVWCFMVWMKDGRKIAYELSERPKVIPVGDLLTLVTERVSIEYPAHEIHKFTLDEVVVLEEPEAIEENISDVKVSMLQDLVVIKGARSNELVRIFSAKGILVESIRTNEEGSAVIPIGDYPQGIYIVKTEVTSIKIIKR